MSAPNPMTTDVATLLGEHGVATYREVLRVAALSLGLFVAPPGHTDTQAPHDQDEVYVVMAGHAVLVVDGIRQPVQTGSITYVPAGTDHRFEDVTADLHVVVVFAPPPRSRASTVIAPGAVAGA